MKTQVLSLLLASTIAQQNIGEDGDGRPDWVPMDWADLIYDKKVPGNGEYWKSCQTNEQCNTGEDAGTENYVCANHMWGYGGQSESGRGCWEFAVCGAESFNMFDGRKIQWFCDSYSSAAANGKDAPYGLEKADSVSCVAKEEYKDDALWADDRCPGLSSTTCDSFTEWPNGSGNRCKTTTKHWEYYDEGCSVDEDCQDGAICTRFLWDGTQDGKSYSQGQACYFWDVGVCPRPFQWGIVNANYLGETGTGFSAYTQFECAPKPIDYSTLASVELHVYTHTPMIDYLDSNSANGYRESGCIAFNKDVKRDQRFIKTPWALISSNMDDCALLRIYPESQGSDNLIISEGYNLTASDYEIDIHSEDSKYLTWGVDPFSDNSTRWNLVPFSEGFLIKRVALDYDVCVTDLYDQYGLYAYGQQCAFVTTKDEYEWYLLAGDAMLDGDRSQLLVQKVPNMAYSDQTIFMIQMPEKATALTISALVFLVSALASIN